MATYKPGEIAPDSGELIEVGPRGGKVEGGRQTVIERGERIPPTSEPRTIRSCPSSFLEMSPRLICTAAPV